MNGDVINAENLRKYYGNILAVDQLLFSVRKGEIFGFLGPNGAGKTTTIRMLTGILEPSSGKIEIFGLDMKKHKIKIRERMGIVPEMANPYIDLSAVQNLLLFGKLYGMKKIDIKEKMQVLLKSFNLYEKKDVKVRAFSKGMKQRLSLAMAMLPDPELLFLDEPTSGLDVVSARLIKRMIKNEQKSGKTIFMSTHNMQDANELCNRIAIINHGKIIAIDTPEKIKKISGKRSVIEFSLYPFRFKKELFNDKMEILGDKVRVYTENVDGVLQKIVKYAEQENLKIITLQIKKPSLEDVFLELVGEKND